MALTLISASYRYYLQCFYKPHNDFHINLIRVFVGLFFAWKVMSRDFGFMGIIPTEFFYYYPYEIYPPSSIFLTLSIPVLMELITFHWVHWVVGFPGPGILMALQYLLAVLALGLAIFGRGPRRILVIAVYCLAVYLWAFIFLSGQDIDSIVIYFGLLLVLCLTRHEDVPVWEIGTLIRKPQTSEAGQAFSAIILVFVVYYGLSGYNKIVDINIFEWFEYDLIQDIEHTLWAQELGNYFGTPFPGIFSIFHGQYWMNFVLVPLVYISHISVFYVFFARQHILKFAIFYAAFHFMTTSVSIAFTGYLFVWWILLDWRGILKKMFVKSYVEIEADAPKRHVAAFQPREIPRPLMQAVFFALPAVAALLSALDTADPTLFSFSTNDRVTIRVLVVAGTVLVTLACVRPSLFVDPILSSWGRYRYSLVVFLLLLLLPASVFDSYFLRRTFAGVIMLPVVVTAWIMLREFKAESWIARAFPLIFVIMAATPGFFLPPFYQGIGGWVRETRPSQEISVIGYQVVNEQGKTAWVTHTLFQPVTQVGRFNSAWLENRSDIGPIEPFILKAYQRYYWLLAEGYMPHQRYLGKFAYPPHTYPTNLPDYSNFPPEQVRRIQLVEYRYDASNTLIETNLYTDYEVPAS